MRRSRPHSGRLPGEKHLPDFSPYANTLVDIIADEHTAAPLTIGVFGAWGRCKTSLTRFVERDLGGVDQRKWDSDPVRTVPVLRSEIVEAGRPLCGFRCLKAAPLLDGRSPTSTQ